MGVRSNQVRIIAGQWRGRKLSFPDADGLRPTPDRVRETLFNWLAPVLPGAQCLDLFAGSGALGFEAASRGAARVVMTERDLRVVGALRESQQRLAAHQVDVIDAEARRYLATSSELFDIVFLDPPFSQPGLLSEAVELLQQGLHLKAGAYIYMETDADLAPDNPPASWVLWKQKQAGAVSYRLYRASRSDHSDA